MLAQIQLPLFVHNCCNSATEWKVHVRAYNKLQDMLHTYVGRGLTLPKSVVTFAITTNISNITMLLFTSIVNSAVVWQLISILERISLIVSPKFAELLFTTKVVFEGKKTISVESYLNVVSTNSSAVLSQGHKYIICLHLYA